MTLIQFTPQDSLFFRDGRPYNKGESSQAGVASSFPPAPPTMVGAVRAGLARSMGWKCGDWDARLQRQLGDESDLGPLCFRGPVLMKDDKSLFPLPANLLVSKTKTKVSLQRLSPGKKIECDLNQYVELAAIETDANGGKGGKFEQGWWVTDSGLELLLQGKLPDNGCLVHQRELWDAEPRVGIFREQDKRVTIEGSLYSPTHIRLKRGVTFAFEAEGIPRDLSDLLTSRPHPVGGEARACWLNPTEKMLPLPKPPSLRPLSGSLKYSVTLLTPADTRKPPQFGENGYAGLPGKVVSACLPRPTLIGGWDSKAGKPLTLRPHLTPGSVIFMETEADNETKVMGFHGKAVGARSPWGFGLAAIGVWHRRSDGQEER